MPDELNTPPQNPTPETPPAQPLGNDPNVRNPDGSIKDPAAPSKEPEKEPGSKKPDEAGKEPGKKDDKLAGAPEKYETFKAPEGMEVDPALVEKATPLFKEMNLSQDQAQKLVDFWNEQVASAVEAPYNQFEDTRKSWRNELAQDKALGNGVNDLKPEVKASLGRLIDSLPPEIQQPFKEAMVLTGAGDNPAFVRVFHNLSQRLAEGSSVKGNNPSPLGQTQPGGQRSAAQSVFPNLPSASSRSNG